LSEGEIQGYAVTVPKGRPGSSLHLAAKAADRDKAAEAQRPEFERRLKELGYTPRSSARAFGLLEGPGTVQEAIQALERVERATP